MYLLALAFHVLAAALWVGGLFFTYTLLRPALGTMERHHSLTIWRNVPEKIFSLGLVFHHSFAGDRVLYDFLPSVDCQI